MKYNIGKEIEVLLSFDDGCREDLRIADLLRLYDLPGIFYIPSKARKLTATEVKELSLDFDIGGHTKNHRILRGIPLPDVECEIQDGKNEIERIIHRPLTSFCYPRGRFTDSVKKEVELAGFQEARTTRVLATKRSEAYELDTTIHAYDRTEYHGENWMGLAIKYIDQVFDPANADDYFHFWAHGWELQKYDTWKEFELVLRYLHDRLHQHAV